MEQICWLSGLPLIGVHTMTHRACLLMPDVFSTCKQVTVPWVVLEDIAIGMQVDVWMYIAPNKQNICLKLYEISFFTYSVYSPVVNFSLFEQQSSPCLHFPQSWLHITQSHIQERNVEKSDIKLQCGKRFFSFFPSTFAFIYSYSCVVHCLA